MREGNCVIEMNESTVSAVCILRVCVLRSAALALVVCRFMWDFQNKFVFKGNAVAMHSLFCITLPTLLIRGLAPELS